MATYTEFGMIRSGNTYLYGDKEARQKIEEYHGYSGDPDVVGIEADFENEVFTRLAAGVGKSGGADFNVFPTYAGMRRCTVSDAGVVTSYYGDNDYAEDGSMGQCMVEIPKFYYKMIPLKLQKQDWEDYEATPWAASTNYAVGRVVTYDGAYYACTTANTDEEFTPAHWHEIDEMGLMGCHILKARYFISAKYKDGFKVHPLFVVKGAGIPENTTRDFAYIGTYGGIGYDVSASTYLLNDEQVIDVTASTGDKLSSVNGTWERSYTYYDKATDENVTITVNTGAKPASGETANNNLTRPKCTIIAENRGTGWEQQTVELVSAIQLLYAIEYCSFNWQNTTGAGITSIADDGKTNCASFMGSTAALGNVTGNAAATTDHTGTSRTTAGTLATSYRGIEDFFGNIYKWIEGVNFYGAWNNAGGQPYINTSGTFTEDIHAGTYEGTGFTIANVSGYIRYFGYGETKYDWLFIPSKTGHGANTAIPVGDYIYVTANLNGHRVAYGGGAWYSTSAAGGLCLAAYGGAGYRYRAIGARLAYLPIPQ